MRTDMWREDESPEREIGGNSTGARNPAASTPALTVGRAALVACARRWQADGLGPEAVADEILSLLARDALWVKAFGHPLRGEVMGLLARRGTLSPAQAAKELEVSVGSISYHFRTLAGLGIVEVDSEIQRRGAVEHVYRLVDSGRGALRRACRSCVRRARTGGAGLGGNELVRRRRGGWVAGRRADSPGVRR